MGDPVPEERLPLGMAPIRETRLDELKKAWQEFMKSIRYFTGIAVISGVLLGIQAVGSNHKFKEGFLYAIVGILGIYLLFTFYIFIQALVSPRKWKHSDR